MQLVKTFGDDALARVEKSEASVKRVSKPGVRSNYVTFQGKGPIKDTPWTFGKVKLPIPHGSVFIVHTDTMQHGYSGFENAGVKGQKPHTVLTEWLDDFPPLPSEEWARQITYAFDATCVGSANEALIGAKVHIEERRAFKEGFEELESALRARLRDGHARGDEDVLSRMYPMVTLDWEEGVVGKYGEVNKAILRLAYNSERAWVGVDQVKPATEIPATVTRR